MWVDEEPYSVWQLDNPAIAARMILRRDAMVQLGQLPHRVTELFVGKEPMSLRCDVERLAEGHGMSSRLREEVRAYQLAKLDDTWAEAVHRDITAHGKRAPASKVPYTVASQRVVAIMASLDSMTYVETAKFHWPVQARAGAQVAACESKARSCDQKGLSMRRFGALQLERAVEGSVRWGKQNCES